MLPLFSWNLELVWKKKKNEGGTKKKYVQDFLLLAKNSHWKLHGTWATNKRAMASKIPQLLCSRGENEEGRLDERQQRSTNSHRLSRHFFKANQQSYKNVSSLQETARSAHSASRPRNKTHEHQQQHRIWKQGCKQNKITSKSALNAVTSMQQKVFKNRANRGSQRWNWSK